MCGLFYDNRKSNYLIVEDTRAHKKYNLQRLPDSDMAQQSPTIQKVGPKTYEKDSNPQLIHCQNCKKEVMTVIELITTDPNKWIGILLCICLWPICLPFGNCYTSCSWKERTCIIHRCPTCRIQLVTYKSYDT